MHGTNEGWLQGCRNKCCLNARDRFRHKKLRRAKLNGRITADTKVPSDHVMKLLDRLKDEGYGYRLIAKNSGLPISTVKRLVYERPPEVSVKTHAKLMNLSNVSELDRSLVNNKVSMRRLQALYWMGYSMEEVVRASGKDLDALNLHDSMMGLRNRKTIHKDTADAIKVAYEYLVVREVPPDNAGGSRKKRRKNAERRGFVPPGRWKNIENLNEEH